MVITGIIRPPPEIRAVADRTALYVAKNGRTFEQRILASEKGKTPKFAFLHLSSPFHAYYEDRIQFYIDGGEDTKDNETTTTENDTNKNKKSDTKQSNETKKNDNNLTEDASKQQQQKKTQQQQQQHTASVIDPVAKALLYQRSKLLQLQSTIEDELESQKTTNEENEAKATSSVPILIPPPPVFHFVNIVAPASLSVVQIETIQLVAQFVALDGKGGSFLQQLTYREWNNPMFAFCQPRHGHFPYFTALVDAYRRILQQITTSSSSTNNSNDPTTEQIQKMANNIDTCLEVTAYRAEYERHIEEQIRKRQEDGDFIETLAKIDWHDFVVVETIDFPPDENVELSMLPPPPPPPVPIEIPAVQQSTKATGANDDNMDESDDDDEPIRVVPTYTPRIVSTHESNKIDTVIDPITGKSVAVKDMPEHMRIQLLDPKWAEERKKFQEKQKESNLVSGDIIAANLQRFAQARGVTGTKQEQDDSSKKRPLGQKLNSSEQHGIGPTFPVPPPPPDQASNKRQRMDNQLDPMLPPPPPPPPLPLSSSLPPLPPRPQGLVLPPVLDIPPAPSAAVYTEDPFAAAATAALPIPASTTPTSSSTAGLGDLMSESDFVATLNKTTFSIQIRVPNDSSQMAWNFYGQIVSLNVDVMFDVKTVKTELSKAHLNGIAPNKIQLKNPATGVFLKDALTLAALNIGPGTTLELVPRARGGKKK